MERFSLQVQEIARAVIGSDEADMRNIVFCETDRSKVFVAPKPFQRLAIPYALAGMNMVIASETGSGKTLVFAMAIFNNEFFSAAPTSPEQATGIRALVIVPSGNRLIVQQHTEVFQRVARHLKQKNDPFWSSPHVRLDDDGRQRHGVASTTFTKRAGGANDVDDDFSQALIRIDSPNRIQCSKTATGGRPVRHTLHVTRSKLSKVKVIAIDEVDKIFEEQGKDGDRECMQDIFSGAPPGTQIISASATMRRTSEKSWPDETTAWLQKCQGQRMPFISLQTVNVLPQSVFHLFVDLRELPEDRQQQVKLAWEKMHSLKSKDAFFRPCYYLCNKNEKLRPTRTAIQESFTDKTDKDDQKPSLVCLTADLTVGAKSKELFDLRNETRSGCIATQSMATGMDHPFRSVILSYLAPGYLLKWDLYTHASGRCGRKIGQLGICVIFIENQVRFPVFCSPEFSSTIYQSHIEQTQSTHWEKMFSELLGKQPDLCDFTGTSGVLECSRRLFYHKFAARGLFAVPILCCCSS